MPELTQSDLVRIALWRYEDVIRAAQGGIHVLRRALDLMDDPDLALSPTQKQTLLAKHQARRQETIDAANAQPVNPANFVPTADEIERLYPDELAP